MNIMVYTNQIGRNNRQRLNHQTASSKRGHACKYPHAMGACMPLPKIPERA